MFAPEFRTTEFCNFLPPLKEFISFNYGDSMWNDMASDMQKIDTNRQNFNNAVPLMNDPVQLENLKKCFL
jgi:hypothetical protein